MRCARSAWLRETWTTPYPSGRRLPVHSQQQPVLSTRCQKSATTCSGSISWPSFLLALLPNPDHAASLSLHLQSFNAESRVCGELPAVAALDVAAAPHVALPASPAPMGVNR